MSTLAPAWREFYRDGCQYLRSAQGGLSRPEIFSPPIAFNLAAMAIEKFAMAMLVAEGDIADNHTMHDLVLSLSRLPDLDLGLLEQIDRLGRFEDLCPMAPPQHHAPSAEDVPAILEVAQALRAAAEERLPYKAQ